MKDISILALLACVILCGCRSDSTLAPGYVSPTQLVGQIQSADHIIVKHLIPGQPDFSTTITGPEVKRIIYAIASARAPACSGPSAPSRLATPILPPRPVSGHRGTGLQYVPLQ